LWAFFVFNPQGRFRGKTPVRQNDQDEYFGRQLCWRVEDPSAMEGASQSLPRPKGVRALLEEKNKIIL